MTDRLVRLRWHHLNAGAIALGGVSLADNAFDLIPTARLNKMFADQLEFVYEEWDPIAQEWSPWDVVEA